MSSTSAPGSNPYASPDAKPAAGPTRLDYGRTVSFIFENPNWTMNALWAFLCQIVGGVIPILPQMVVLGYQFEMLDGLLASRGQRYPDFDANRLVDYFVRGLWPILAALIVAIVWIPVFIVVLLLSIGATALFASIGGKDLGPVLGTIGGLATAVVVIALIMVMLVVVTPIAIRAGMARDFGAAFDFAWIIDFVKKTWLEMILGWLALVVLVLAATILTCGIGAVFAGAFVPFVKTHFWYQFYTLYLERGGQPVLPKMPLPMMAPQPGYVPPKQP